MDSKGYNYSIPFTRVLAAVLGLVLTLMWFFPILPAGDGPYQTLNWISRIKEGQLPGRDFDVFHGLGVLWFHAVLALPASTARGVIFVHALGSLIAQFLLWMVVFRSQNRNWRRSATYSAALCGMVALSAGVPLGNFNVLLSAGHSMIGARVALTLVVLYMAHVLTSSGRIKRRFGSAVMGIAAGLGAWISTDQATAAVMMATAYSIFGSLSNGRARWWWPLRAGLSGAVAAITALFTYLILVWFMTSGAPARSLTYWWKDIPAVQFSYFGGAPDPFFRTLGDLLNPGLLVFLGVSASMHLIGFRWRKPGQTSLVIGLAGYGAVSLLPLMATFALHYLSGVFCTGLISLLVSNFPDALARRSSAILSRPTLRYIFILMVVLLAARMTQVHLKNASCVKDPHFLSCELLPGLNEEALAAPEFVRAARSTETSQALLRAFYRGMPEVSTGQAGVGRYDYIIHALGDGQREEYLTVLQSTKPLFLRTPIQSNFIFSQWIWHQWPELWTWILENYRFEVIWNGSAYWKNTAGDRPMPKRKVETVIQSNRGKFTISCLEATAPDSLMALKISYRSKPVGGPLAGFVDRCTRVTVKGSGVLDSQSFSWPPGHGELMTKRLLLIPMTGDIPSVSIITEGPLLASGLEIVEVEAEELKSESRARATTNLPMKNMEALPPKSESCRTGLVPKYADLFAGLALAVSVLVIFFGVDLRFGFPHFDTYQYSASVGPQAKGLRPILLGVETLPGFENGAELALPGIYWAKRTVFSVVPYSLRSDQAISLMWLIGAAGMAWKLLLRSRWGREAGLLSFALILTDPTFLVNATGTRPEPLAVLLLLSGLWVIRKNRMGFPFTGGLLLGLAGTVHVYAALLGPLIALAGWLGGDSGSNQRGFRRALFIGLGLATGWALLAVFWWSHSDAWHLFRTNLAVQRTFHRDPGRFMAYLSSFKLGSGGWIALLLVLIPLLSWVSWFRAGWSKALLIMPLVSTACCLIVPAAYWILKTDQYFYGVMVWPGLVSAMVACPVDRIRFQRWVSALMALALLGGIARLAARVILGYKLRNSASAAEMRLEWLRSRVSGAPTLYVFTREWDIAFQAGAADVRFYTFPLPMTPQVVSDFEWRTFLETRPGAMLLFDRDYAQSCPYVNRNAFDPAKSNDWEMLETKVWNYDLSPLNPPARIWEMWRKKPGN